MDLAQTYELWRGWMQSGEEPLAWWQSFFVRFYKSDRSHVVL